MTRKLQGNAVVVVLGAISTLLVTQFVSLVGVASDAADAPALLLLTAAAGIAALLSVGTTAAATVRLAKDRRTD